jgi:hypothetical protein
VSTQAEREQEVRPVQEAAPKSPVAAPAAAPEYTANIYPGKNGKIPPQFAEAVLALEEGIGRPVWRKCCTG